MFIEGYCLSIGTIHRLVLFKRKKLLFLGTIHSTVHRYYSRLLLIEKNKKFIALMDEQTGWLNDLLDRFDNVLQDQFDTLFETLAQQRAVFFQRQNDAFEAFVDQVLEESNLQTSDKVEVVPTSMVANYDEHGKSGDGEQDDAIESGDILILNSWVGQGSPRSLQLWDTLGSRKVHILIIGARSKLKEVLLS
ncbi:hypothetical protein Tco_0907434 [Tanacetum coccineum]|uniref:Uncharacterized protein n=1 Tax=Tanacetum coccineum TaxID=301880 RepID=A0ABQ5CQQ7_9ASTR